MNLRPASSEDFQAILVLNEDAVHFLSPLSEERLAMLHGEAELHQVVEAEGQVVAFLLAFRESAAYDGVNFQWFCKRYSRFLYIDRIVVSSTIRSKGAGSLLYKSAFTHASRTSTSLLACEFDVEPPNPESAQFHAKFGFKEVGRQSVNHGRKVVSLQIASLPVLAKNES